MATYFKKGSWNAICEVCGFQYKSHEMKKRWDGVMVCVEDWEPRHPLDFQRGKAEVTAVPWTSTDDTEGTVSITTKSASQDYAITDTAYSVLIQTTGASVTVTFPETTDAVTLSEKSLLVPRMYRIANHEDSTNSLTFVVTGSDAFVGSTTLLVGQTAIITSIPSQAIWQRLS